MTLPKAVLLGEQNNMRSEMLLYKIEASRPPIFLEAFDFTYYKNIGGIYDESKTISKENVR